MDRSPISLTCSSSHKSSPIPSGRCGPRNLSLLSTTHTLQHEDASVAMFQHMLKENGELGEAFKQAGLSDNDVVFIEEQIAGPKDTELVGRGGGEEGGREGALGVFFKMLPHNL